MFDETTLSQYRSLKDNAAVVDLDSCLVQLTGSDRHQFLHNFCTNEIKELPDSGVCEAFILDGKGKILFHVHVLNGQDALWLHSVAGDAEAMVEHLDKYLLRDDVQMTVIADRISKFVAGPKAGTALSDLLPSTLPENQLMERPSGDLIAHVELAGWGYLILSNDENVIPSSVESASPDALHSVRIENQTPWMGVDINDSNLPQELLRDDKCVSFTKGCYLGQETVARIDAIGRVNRVIALVESKDVVESGAELMLENKKIGDILSVSWSPDQDCFCALAMIRRPHEKIGTELACGSTSVTVV